MDDFERDLDLVDMEESKKMKKKVDGKAKGNRGELQLAKLLTAHFKMEFSRGVGSGNRWSQVTNMPQHAKDTFLGDLCVPEGFLWVIECKDGYEDDIDLGGLKGFALLDEWMEKAVRDSTLSGRKPIICWKRKWKPWICFIRLEDFHDCYPQCDHYLYYKGWFCTELEKLFEETKLTYWFDSYTVNS
jgi:hypothetical protein